MNLNTPLREIAQDIYTQYYSKPYPGQYSRLSHDMDHATRAMIAGTVAYRLMALNGTQFNAEDLKLIQIALLLHDSAREGDGPDIWDEQSGLNIYHYLTKTLGVNSVKAKQVSEAMTNKDWKAGATYFSLNTDRHQFEKIKNKSSLDDETNNLRLPIQFGDCVDIFRMVGSSFNWECIDLYKESDPDFLKVIERIVPECFELIEKSKLLHIKREEAFDSLMKMLDDFPLLQTLYEGSNQETLKMLATSGDPITDAFHSMNLLLRGVSKPVQHFVRTHGRKTKIFPTTFPPDYPANYPRERSDAGGYPKGYSGSHQEVRKMRRLPHVKTWSHKEALGKSGNPARSTILLGQNAYIFTPVGGGLILREKDLIDAQEYNMVSGFGAKPQFAQAERGQNLTSKLNKMRKNMRTGSSKNQQGEVVTDLDEWDCILYCADTLPNNPISRGERILTAIYLRDVYREYPDKNGNKVELPIYEYSLRLGYCRKKDIHDDLIHEAFEEPLRAYIDKKLHSDDPHAWKNLQELSIADWMADILGENRDVPLDAFYTDQFRKSLYQQLDWVKTQSLAKHRKILESYNTHDEISSEEMYSHALTLLRMDELGILPSQAGHHLANTIMGCLEEAETVPHLEKIIDVLHSIAEMKNPSSFQADINKLSLAHADHYFHLLHAFSDADTEQLVSDFNDQIEKKMNDFLKLLLSANPYHAIALFAKPISDILTDYLNETDVQLGEYFTQAIYSELLTQLTQGKQTLIDHFLLENDLLDKITKASDLKFIYDHALRSGKLPPRGIKMNDEQWEYLKKLQLQAVAFSKNYPQGQRQFFVDHFQKLKLILNHDAAIQSDTPSRFHLSYRVQTSSVTPVTPIARFAETLAKSDKRKEIDVASKNLNDIAMKFRV